MAGWRVDFTVRRRQHCTKTHKKMKKRGWCVPGYEDDVMMRGKAWQQRYSWRLPAPSRWDVKVGGTSMDVLRTVREGRDRSPKQSVGKGACVSSCYWWWCFQAYDAADDVYHDICWRLKLEGETENMGICTCLMLMMLMMLMMVLRWCLWMVYARERDVGLY